jgi:hypothetical protein
MEEPTGAQSAPDLYTELGERLRFETLLTEISARLAWQYAWLGRRAGSTLP